MNAAGVDDRPTGRSRDAAVEVSDLVVAYGPHRAVQGVSLSITQGSTVAVIGPSGSGKSSLLRAISGLEPVDSGTISLFGVDHTSSPPNERHVGLMFQDHVLFPHLDVAGNVGFGLKMQRSDEPVILRRTAEALEMVGLADFGSRSIETLSGGEAQRVALARSLAPSPKVLMLDEPLGSLDRVLREDLISELRGLFAQLDLTVIHVTHDQQEAFSLADRVIVMRDGRIEQEGPPAEIWHRPETSFVASFLGHQNIWPAGSGAVLAPIPSLSIVDSEVDGAIHAEVLDSEFREGRYRITARERLQESGEPRRFVVETARRFDAGETNDVWIAIDQSKLVALDGAVRQRSAGTDR